MNEKEYLEYLKQIEYENVEKPIKKSWRKEYHPPIAPHLMKQEKIVYKDVQYDEGMPVLQWLLWLLIAFIFITMVAIVINSIYVDLFC